jgi:HEAT repeat protein
MIMPGGAGHRPDQPAAEVGKSPEMVLETIVHILTEEEDADIREDIVETLGEIGVERVVEPLLRALNDEDSWVRESAVEALGEIGTPRAIEPLRQILDNPDEDEDVIKTAEDVLKELLSQG